jgi:lysophospholipase L1-like esterase
MIYAVGGSTMLGRGCPQGSAYVEVLENKYGLKLKILAEDLVGIKFAISSIEEIPDDSTLVLQIGAGDQIRMMKENFRRWLPGNLGTSKIALDQPLYKSYFKYLLKKYLIRTPIYSQETSLMAYQEFLRELASIAERKRTKIVWVTTVKGFYRTPNFLKAEKEQYSGYGAFKIIENQIPFGSCFLDLERFILESDTCIDGFHLNSEGHRKLAEALAKVLK